MLITEFKELTFKYHLLEQVLYRSLRNVFGIDIGQALCMEGRGIEKKDFYKSTSLLILVLQPNRQISMLVRENFFHVHNLKMVLPTLTLKFNLLLVHCNQ